VRVRLSFAAFLTAALGLVPASPSVAATIEVTTLNDEVAVDGDCSLREAMISAGDNVSLDACVKGRGGAERDTIELADAEYGLDLPGTGENASQTGDLDYMGGGKLTIRCAQGDGCGINALSAGDRAIHVSEDAKSLRLERLFLEDASAVNGGLVYADTGALSLDRVDVRSGTVSNLGGGVWFGGSEGLKVTRSAFYLNEARGGGAIYAPNNARVSISKSVFSDNEAEGTQARGGAVWAFNLSVARSMFLDNSAVADESDSSGGAVFGTDARVSRSYFGDNISAVTAGGVGADGGALGLAGDSAVTNSTFFDNASQDDGGAVSGEAKLAHTTFLQNSAEDDGDHVYGTAGGISLRNSILPGAMIAVDVCAGTTSKGFNVFSYDDPGCGTLDSDVADGGNAGLQGPPAPNGGSTWTIPISADSVAKDLIPKRKCRSAKGVDQRGFERPKGPRCDAGAFERGAKP